MATDHSEMYNREKPPCGCGGVGCASCAFGPFTRNHYFTGKLLVERDFTDETRYHSEKHRHHQIRLHGTGVVCGLKVLPHPNPACRDRYVIIAPGAAVDCCGRDILVREEETLDLQAFPAVARLFQNDDKKPHVLQICVRFRECATEEIPVLYDDCGCDDTQCAPNRILESFDFDVLIDPTIAPAPANPADCDDIRWRDLEGCPPRCDGPDCVILATIRLYRPGDTLEPKSEPPAAPDDANADDQNNIARIDNRTDRRLLLSTQTLQAWLECIAQQGGAVGPQGPAGPGLETGLTAIARLSWSHNKPGALANVITSANGAEQPGLVIEFTGEVNVADIDPNHVFEVLAVSNAKPDSGFVCRCGLTGRIAAVEVFAASGDVITAAKEVPMGMASAVAFLPGEAATKTLTEGKDIWARLRGDFVIDAGKRAIDAEFVRAALPTGDRIGGGSGLGLQGGIFESWFTVAGREGREIYVNDKSKS